jgi:periplasmic protein TonB
MANDILQFDNEVFENRNKAYGAYFLRRVYKNNVLIGFLISASIISLALAGPLVYKAYFGGEVVDGGQRKIIVKLAQIKTKIEEPKVKVEEIIPKAASAKKLPPEVKPDTEVKTDEKFKTDDEMKDKNPGKEDQEGKKNTPVELPSNAPEPAAPVEPKIETWAEQMPVFPGGPSELMGYFADAYTDEAREEEIEGTVRISFVINIDGSISEIKLVKGIGHGVDEQVLKLAKKMPKWKPGVKKGTVVPIRMVQPIGFQLN